MAYDRVIVFGATGNVGAVVAQTAHKLGAHVALAMRDLQKSVRGLDSTTEQAGNYTRVKADFSDSGSVKEAVQETKAKAAFVYLHHGSPDHSLSTFEALKAGGVEFVVFLSSFTVQGDDLSKIPPNEVISFVHAQAELNLAKVFGDKYVAIRPGAFATNTLRELPMIKARRIKLYHPENEADYVTSTDMGEVSGTILVQGPKDGQKVVFVFGASNISAQEAHDIIGEALYGKKPVIETITDRDEAIALNVQAGVPPPFAAYLVHAIEAIANGTLSFDTSAGLIAKGHENIRRYLGREPVAFREWVENHKDLYE